MFEIGDESLTNENMGRPETVLRARFEKNPGNTVRDYAEELGVSSLNVSRHLKLIGKVKKKRKTLINGFFLN